MNTDYLNRETGVAMKQFSISTFDNTQLRTKIYETAKQSHLIGRHTFSWPAIG